MKGVNQGIMALAFVMLASCITPQKQMIFKGMEYDQRYSMTLPEEVRIQKFDRLNIQVLSDIPQLAAPFNATLNFSESEAGGQKAVTYEVSREGMIDFPKLGQARVEGMTIRELESTLALAIREHGFIKDPLVKVSLENFEITVIGVNNEVMTIAGGMNLIQLLARVGGPAPGFRMDDVMVIRTIDGARVPFQVDLRKKEVFDSPVFYLQQNDIVYFKPRTTIFDPAVQGLISPITYFTSMVSVVTSILVLLKLSE